MHLNPLSNPNEQLIMEKHIPWQFESGTLRYSTDLLEEIYRNKIIDDYLRIGNHDHNFVLVGPKGIGKTLFLNLKSYLYRNEFKDKGIFFYPRSGQLCENLILDNNLLSKEDLLRFTDVFTWSKVWRLILSVVTCQTVHLSFEEDEMDETLRELLHPPKSLSTLLTYILLDRSNLDKYLARLNFFTQKVEQISSGICIFIDNIDQAFGHFLTDYHYSDYDDYRIPPAVEVWTSAQMGLMAAIYEMNRHNSHIKIYSTIRLEAFRCINSQMKLNYSNFAIFLKYTKEEVRAIFEKNIDMMEAGDYTNPEKTDCVEK